MHKKPVSYATNLIIILLLLGSTTVLADVRLPRILGDGLVLQRDTSNKIWGWADTGEPVALKLNGEEVGSTVAVDGRWMILLRPLPTGGQRAKPYPGQRRLFRRRVDRVRAIQHGAAHGTGQGKV
ncbi:hypothetical protein ACFL00_04625 [Pseudomonadota bacterium]